MVIKTLAKTLLKMRKEAKARIAKRAKTKAVPLPKGVRPSELPKNTRQKLQSKMRANVTRAEHLGKLQKAERSIARIKAKGGNKLVGDLTKKKKSSLSAADQVRQASQFRRKTMKMSVPEMRKKIRGKTSHK